MSDEITLDQLMEYAGKQLAPTPWIVMDQQRINQFADCTGDHQYIHVDPERMKDSEIGCTIAHGFHSLALTAGHPPQDWPRVKDTVMSLNYGLDRVRFITPVKVDSRVRLLTEIVSVTEKSPGQVVIKAKKTMEIEGQTKPAMVAEVLFMVVTKTP